MHARIPGSVDNKRHQKDHHPHSDEQGVSDAGGGYSLPDARRDRLSDTLALGKVVRYHYGLITRRFKQGSPMPRPASTDGPDKFQRYRTTQCSRGMRLLRGWVLDPRAPGFQEQAHRQALLLRGAPEESEALDFIEAAADQEP
jgi:hypothetical protein